MKYYKKVLKNGLTILEVPSTEAESVIVNFFVATGSRSETDKENGISHFLEHFLFKGTKKYPTAMAITEIVDGIGGEMNANTGKEHTQYFIKAHSKNMPLIFDILTSMLQEPLLDKVELEKEKGVIIEELNMYKDMHQYEAEEILEEVLWSGSTLGRRVVGSAKTVTEMTVPMFESYLKRHYQPRNMVLAIAGKYDRAKFAQLVKLHWAVLPNLPYNQFKKFKSTQKAPKVKVEHKETNQTHMVLGFHTFAMGDKRNYAASVLASILGGGMSSRLFDEIREQRGLAYYVRSSNHVLQDTGVFNISSGVQNTKAVEALQVILDQLKRLQTEKVSKTELQKAKEYLKGRTTLALEDNHTKMEWFLDQIGFKTKEILTPKELFKRIDAVTIEDVQKLAKKVFVKENLNFALVGPQKTDSDFKKVINNF